jgi:hypothetical protein
MIEPIVIATAYLVIAFSILAIWTLALMVAYDVIRTIAKRLEEWQHWRNKQ